MEARFFRAAAVAVALVSTGATWRSPNFVVTAPSEEVARQVAETAERSRDELAVAWLGHKLRRWYRPCTVKVKVGQMGAGGATTFAFDQGEVFGWRMTVQGTLERILDSVVPHEVSHTIFASHFRRPLPRWADEGAATLIEHDSERRRQQLLLKQVWHTSQRMPLERLLAIREYPSEMRAVMTLYSQGHSLSDFLVQAGGRTRFLQFLDEAERHGWDKAIRTHYSLAGVDELERRWEQWVESGSPEIAPTADDVRLVDNGRQPRSDGIVVRSQSPDAGGGGRQTGKPTDGETDRSFSLPTSSGLREALNDGWMPAPAERLSVERDAAAAAPDDNVIRIAQPREAAEPRILRDDRWSDFPR
ncbi:MAG: hypothetical protein KY476_19145 [Planctomycetes bacterium]|nr:hypothetical protein [Planctomycetota bacterium]